MPHTTDNRLQLLNGPSGGFVDRTIPVAVTERNLKRQSGRRSTGRRPKTVGPLRRRVVIDTREVRAAEVCARGANVRVGAEVRAAEVCAGGDQRVGVCAEVGPGEICASEVCAAK